MPVEQRSRVAKRLKNFRLRQSSSKKRRFIADLAGRDKGKGNERIAGLPGPVSKLNRCFCSLQIHRNIAQMKAKLSLGIVSVILPVKSRTCKASWRALTAT
jgi:hypothetical protein